MSLDHKDSRPVHYPANPNKFAFDAEVAAIFDDMAVRSIPNFLQAHATHASMCTSWLDKPGATVMDVGASRGAFFRALRAESYGHLIDSGGIKLHAVDSSQQMCEYLRHDFPMADVRCMDITGEEFLNDPTTYDVVCAHYVLQFVPEELQSKVLIKLFQMVRQGGVLVFGHKSAYYGQSGALSHEQYIQFRMRNGYTREEIEAKTQALKGSMFPMRQGRLMNSVRGHFSDVAETHRFMMFCTFFAIK